MEDFVYIILAVVWLVISILGNKKRKAQQAQNTPPAKEQEVQHEPVPEPQPQEPSDFEVLLDDFFGDEPKKTPKRVPTEKEENVFSSDKYPHEERKYQNYPTKEAIPDDELEKYEGADAIDDDYEFSAEGELETIENLIKSYDEKERQLEEEKIVVVDVEDEDSQLYEWEFNGRDAIVYSEIINRRYS